MRLQLSNIVAPGTEAIGNGFTVIQFREQAFNPGAGSPFIMVDHFRMWKPTFEVHPHAGISAVTLAFEDSRGEMESCDSIGHRTRFSGGDLHWTMAGKGIWHTQFPIDEQAHIHALQIFVDLPAHLKQSAPDSFRVPHQDMPLIEKPGVRTRIVAGEMDGKKSPARTPSPVPMLDIYLDSPQTTCDIPLPAGWSAWLIVVDGALNVQDKQDLRTGAALCASTGSAPDTLHLRVISQTHCVLLAAPPMERH